jgi:hypothetical protein
MASTKSMTWALLDEPAESERPTLARPRGELAPIRYAQTVRGYVYEVPGASGEDGTVITVREEDAAEDDLASRETLDASDAATGAKPASSSSHVVDRTVRLVWTTPPPLRSAAPMHACVAAAVAQTRRRVWPWLLAFASLVALAMTIAAVARFVLA